MKKAHRYLKISWGMTFIILIMWLLADIGIFRKYSFSWYDQNFKYIDATDGYTYRTIETYYGFGKNLYYSWEQNIIVDSIEPKILDLKILEDDEEETSTEITLGACYKPWWAWWAERLPGFRLGWLLIVFFLITFILLNRKSSKTTSILACPENEDGPSILYTFYPERRPVYEKTRTIVNPRAIYVFLGMTLFFAFFFVVADFYLVYFRDLIKFHEFSFNSKIDTSFRNFEYLLPSIVYLVASVISAFCIVKYIKAVKNLTMQSEDISLN